MANHHIVSLLQLASILSELVKEQELNDNPDLINQMQSLFDLVTQHCYGVINVSANLGKTDQSKPKDETGQPLTESVEPKEDPLLGDALKLLEGESKPSHVLLTKKLRISTSRAKEIFATLVDTGALEALKTDEPSTKKTKKKTKKKVKKVKDITELIDQLPAGDDLLIGQPLNYLIALPKDRREPYLKGLNLNDLITESTLERAVKHGADRTIVDQIIELQGQEREPVANPLTNIGEKGDAEGEKYAKFIKSWVSVIPKGDELYNHMVAMGANKRVLSDLKIIAVAVKDKKV